MYTHKRTQKEVQKPPLTTIFYKLYSDVGIYYKCRTLQETQQYKQIGIVINLLHTVFIIKY